MTTSFILVTAVGFLAVFAVLARMSNRLAELKQKKD